MWRARAARYAPAPCRVVSLRRGGALLAAVVLLPATAVSAAAATKHGITPTAPRAGSTVALGTATTFKLRVRGSGPVYVHVCRSPKRDKHGVICDRELIQRAKRVGARRYAAKVRFFDFPTFWLNQAGTYYWQANRIACVKDTTDCRQEGPVVKFRVG